MGAMSRNKGASFEREMAQELHRLLGINFKRNLDQCREKDLGDLIADTPFPFLIECKRYAGGEFQKTWWKQAYTAAFGSGQHPAVIYRFDRRPVRVRVQLRAAMECLSRHRWSAEDSHIIDVDLEGFAYLCREGLAAMMEGKEQSTDERPEPLKGAV